MDKLDPLKASGRPSAVHPPRDYDIVRFRVTTRSESESRSQELLLVDTGRSEDSMILGRGDSHKHE